MKRIETARAALAADKAANDRMTTILDEIELERRRQIEGEGFTRAHDDDHDDGSLSRAAACYALHDSSLRLHPISGGQTVREWLWPWERSWWKPKDRRRNLILAASLLVAEIERLDRKSRAA